MTPRAHADDVARGAVSRTAGEPPRRELSDAMSALHAPGLDEIPREADARIDACPLEAPSSVRGTVAESTAVLIVANDPTSQLRLVRIIETQRTCAVVAEHGSAALAACETNARIAGAVVDLCLGAEDGLIVLVHLRHCRPRIPVLVVSEHLSEHVMARAVELDAAVLPKPPEREAVGAFVRRASVQHGDASAAVGAMLAEMARVCCWTPRELQVVQGAERGLSPEGTAAELGISPGAVKKARCGAVSKARQSTMACVVERLHRAVIYNERLLPDCVEAAYRERERAAREAVRRRFRAPAPSRTMPSPVVPRQALERPKP